jgi:O-antigen/teichoic acid export membrane protein
MIVSPIRIFADAQAIGSFDKFMRTSLTGYNKEQKIRGKAQFLWKLLAAFSVLYFIVIFYLSETVVDFISHGHLLPNLALILLFGFSTFLDGAIVIYMQIAISSGNQGKSGVSYFLFTLLGLILLPLLILFRAIYAGAISIILCDLFFIFSQLYLHKRKVRL